MVFSKSLIFFFKSRDKRKMAQLAKTFAGKSDNLVIPQNPNGGPLISTHVPWHWSAHTHMHKGTKKYRDINVKDRERGGENGRKERGGLERRFNELPCKSEERNSDSQNPGSG